MVDIELQKERFVWFLFLFVGELVLYLQSLLLRVSFQWSSWVASLQKFCYEVLHVLLNFVLEEFFLSSIRASSLTNPLLTLVGWHEEKWVYWKFSVGLEWVRTSSIASLLNLSPLHIFVSMKFLSVSDISAVNQFLISYQKGILRDLWLYEKEIYGSLRNPKRNLVVNIHPRYFSVKSHLHTKSK